MIKSEIFNKARIVFVFKVLGFGLMQLFLLVLSKYFNVEDIGRLQYLNVSLGLVCILPKLGFDTFTTKYIAEKKDDLAEKSNYFFNIFFRVIVINLFLAIILLSISFYFKFILLDEDSHRNLMLLSILVIPFQILGLNAAYFRGEKKMVAFSIFKGNFGSYLFYFILLFFVYIFELPLYVECFYIITVCFLCVISTIKVFKEVDFSFFNFKGFDFISKLNTSKYFLLSSISFFIIGWIDVFFIKYFYNNETLGYYTVLLKITTGSSFILTSFNAILAPKIVEMWKKNDLDEIQKQVSSVTKVLSITSIVIFLILILFSSSILNFYGPGFHNLKTVFFVLLISQLINSFSGPTGIILQMTENYKIFHRILLISIILNITLNVFLIHTYGIFGLAVASAITMLFRNFISILVIKKRIGIKILF